MKLTFFCVLKKKKKKRGKEEMTDVVFTTIFKCYMQFKGRVLNDDNLHVSLHTVVR